MTEASLPGGTSPTIAVTGELDISNADALAARVEGALRDGARRVVFDLDGLEFVDSSGLAVLLRTANEVEVVLRHVPDLVQSVIDTMGLTSVLRVEP
jgi:anti-sigma B factor antagonist